MSAAEDVVRDTVRRLHDAEDRAMASELTLLRLVLHLGWVRTVEEMPSAERTIEIVDEHLADVHQLRVEGVAPTSGRGRVTPLRRRPGLGGAS